MVVTYPWIFKDIGPLHILIVINCCMIAASCQVFTL